MPFILAVLFLIGLVSVGSIVLAVLIAIFQSLG